MVANYYDLENMFYRFGLDDTYFGNTIGKTHNVDAWCKVVWIHLNAT